MNIPRVAMALCVVRDGKVLLHERKGDPSEGMWAFPGGHLEYQEGFVEACLRELGEEVGDMVVTEPKLWTVVNTVYEHCHYVVVFMYCDWISGEARIMEPHKCARWEWFDWDNLPTPLIGGNKAIKEMGARPPNEHQ